jgi:hypothetical protein
MTSDEKIAISVLVAFLLGMLLGFNMGKEDIKMCTLNRTTTGENK